MNEYSQTPHYDILIDGETYEGSNDLKTAVHLYKTVDNTCLREYYGHTKTLRKTEGRKMEILQEGVILKPFINVRVHYSDGNQMETIIRLSPEEAKYYYLNNPWTFYNSLKGKEYKVTATKLEILNSDGETVLEYGV